MDFRVAQGIILLVAGLGAVPAQGADRLPTLQLVQYAEPGGSAVNRLPQNANAAPPAIQLLNDPDSGGDVRFLVNGREYSLQPGQALDLSNDEVQTVDFNSGGAAGDRRFSLYSGLYKFKVAGDGWMLFKSADPPSRTASRATAAADNVPTPPAPHPELARRRSATGSPPPPAATTARPKADDASPPPTPKPPEPSGASKAPEPSTSVPRRNAPPEDDDAQPQGLNAPKSTDDPPPPPTSAVIDL